MAVAPMAMMWIGRVPGRLAAGRVIILSPLILGLCVAAVVYESAAIPTALGPLRGQVRAGWLVAGGIAGRFVLGLLALTAVMSTTRFSLVLRAMSSLRVPSMVVMQVGFLYRYIFVLLDEAMRMRRARSFRGSAVAPVSRRLAAVGGIAGVLFLRTLDRSQRVHLAMQARGWRGEPVDAQAPAFTARDGVFLAAVAAYLVICRFVIWI